jgi:hypothetical protein
MREFSHRWVTSAYLFLFLPELNDSDFGFCGRQTPSGLDAHRQNRSN